MYVIVKVISGLLSNLGTHDGTVVVVPCITVDITDELVETVNSEKTNVIHDVVLYINPRYPG